MLQPRASPHLDRFQSVLVNAIRNLEAAIELLTLRIGRGEVQLGRLEKDVLWLAVQVASVRTSGAAEISAIADQESYTQNHLRRLENQLQTGERRLNNQDQAVQTITMVIQSMSDDFESGEESRSAAASSARPGPAAELLPPVDMAVMLERMKIRSTQALEFAPELPGSADLGQEEDFPSLQRNGQQFSEGGRSHPDGCRPCSFYCFSRRGCKKALGCEYCHMLHISRSSRRAVKSEHGPGQRRISSARLANGQHPPGLFLA